MASFTSAAPAASETSGDIDFKLIKRVAWMGGSLSPPTKAHFTVALEIGRKLRESSKSGESGESGERCRVCIVPVSPGYGKPSISEKCVPNEARFELAKSLVNALNAEKNDSELDFVIEDHEYKSPTAVTTFDSLNILKAKYTNATIYISQGQDNIEAIFKRKWANSDELLKYGFIVYPRGTGETDIKKDGGPLVSALQSPQSESRGGAFPPLMTSKEYGPVLDRTQVINTTFNDDTSSSELRKEIRDNNLVKVQEMFHPTVYDKYKVLKAENPEMYTSEDCEIKPKPGGNKNTKRRRNMKKRRSYRKKKANSKK
jgi:nicotinic acid mononucleotide adenylyltransferase